MNRTTANLPKADDLTAHDPQYVADECRIPIVWTDHQATRRQRLHGANVPDGNRSYTSTHLVEVLEWLAHEGFVDAILICETPRTTHVACYIEFHPLDGAH